jgi:hypothetical protein
VTTFVFINLSSNKRSDTVSDWRIPGPVTVVKGWLGTDVFNDLKALEYVFNQNHPVTTYHPIFNDLVMWLSNRWHWVTPFMIQEAHESVATSKFPDRPFYLFNFQKAATLELLRRRLGVRDIVVLTLAITLFNSVLANWLTTDGRSYSLEKEEALRAWYYDQVFPMTRNLVDLD